MRGYLILPIDVNWVDYESEWEELLGPGFHAHAMAELERMAMEDLEQQELFQSALHEGENSSISQNEAEQQELAELGVDSEGGVPCE